MGNKWMHTKYLKVLGTALLTWQFWGCSQQQRTTGKVGAPTPATSNYNPYATADAQTLADQQRLAREAADRAAKQCTTTSCDPVKFRYTIAQGENSDEKGSLWGYTKHSVTWSLTPTPNINLGNRVFKFKVNGAPSDARISADATEIKILFLTDHSDNGNLEIIARDMDYCEIEKQNNNSIDCNDLGSGRTRDEVDNISYQVLDEKDKPETAEERQIRLQKEADQKAARATRGNAIGCIAQRGAGVLNANNQLGDLIGSIAGVLAGGTGQGCAPTTVNPY